MTATPPTLTSLSTFLLSKVGRDARAQLAERLAAKGMRLWHMATLAALADFGPHTQRDLASRLAVHPSDMAKLLDELAGRDLVSRERDPRDRRRIRVTVTPAGRTALTDLTGEATAVQDAVLAPLSAEERAVLHGLLLRLYGEEPEARAAGDR